MIIFRLLTIPIIRYRFHATKIIPIIPEPRKCTTIGCSYYFQDLNYAEFNMKEMANVVAAVSNLIDILIQPNVDITKDWGDLNKTQRGLDIKKQFLGDFTSFVNFVESMHY